MQVTRDWRLFNLLTSDFRLTEFREIATYMITNIPHTSDITRVFIVECLKTGAKTVLKVCENINNNEKQIAEQGSKLIPNFVVKLYSIRKAPERPDYILMHMEYGTPLRSYLKSICTRKDGLCTLTARKLIHDMGCALQALHALNYHHRDVRIDNFVVCSDGNPKLIDFGLAMARGDRRSALNNQEFVRPPEFVYCDHLTPEKQIIYEDQHDIYAFGMTVLEMLGISADYNINYHHQTTLKELYSKEVQLCSSRRIAEILDLKPWYQSIRLVLLFGMPPVGHYFYKCDVGRYLTKIYNWLGLPQFSGVNFETELSQEPILRQFIKQALHWDKSERVQSCKEMFEVYFDLLPIL